MQDEIILNRFWDENGVFYVQVQIHVVGHEPVRYNLPERVARELLNELQDLLQRTEPVKETA